MDKKKPKLLLISLFFLMFTGSVVSSTVKSQEQFITVEAILDQYMSACGGSELGSIKTEQRAGILVKGRTGKVPFTSLSTASGKWYYNQVFAFGDQVGYGFDGQNAWVGDQDGITDMAGSEILDLKILFDIRFPLRMSALFPEMIIKKEIGMADKEHVILLAKTSDGLQIELEFDKKSGLLIRSGNIYFYDYKKTGGIMRPHKIVFGHESGEDGLRLMMEVHKISFNGPVDEKSFRRPCCPLKPVKAPLYTRRRQITVSNETLETLVGEYEQKDKPENVFMIKRQDNHLMMKTPRLPYFIEIKPETKLDYFIRFLNLEVHFVKNIEGMVTHLEIGQERNVVAKRTSPK